MIENPVKTSQPATTPAGGQSGSKIVPAAEMNHFLSVKPGRMFSFLGHTKTCPGNFDKLNANGILDWVMLGPKLKQPFLFEHFSFCFSNQENMLRLWKPGERNVYCMYRLYQICISGLINSSFSQYNEAKNKNHHRWRKALNGNLLLASNQEIISDGFGQGWSGSASCLRHYYDHWHWRRDCGHNWPHLHWISGLDIKLLFSVYKLLRDIVYLSSLNRICYEIW